MTKTQSSLYLSQAEKFWLEGDFKAARVAFGDARDECLKNGDYPGVAETQMKLGDFERAQGRTEQAKEAYTDALSMLLLEYDAQKLSGELKLKLAQIALEQEEYEETERLLEHAESLFDEVSDAAGLARAAEMRGLIAMTQGDYEKAVPFYARAAELNAAEKNTLKEAVLLRTLARLYMSLNRMDEAHDVLEKSIVHFRENGDLLGEAGALVAVGILRTTIGDYMLAARAFRKAIMLYGKLGHAPGEGEACFYLARLEAMGGSRESLRNAARDYRRSIELLDGVFWPELVEKAKHELERLKDA